MVQKKHSLTALALPEESDLPYNPGRIHRGDKGKRAFTRNSNREDQCDTIFRHNESLKE